MPPALRSLAAGLVAPWLFAGCDPTPEPLRPLLVNGLEAALAPGEVHLYRLELGPEEVLEIIVEQRGVDVLLRPFENGRPTPEIDSPNGTRGVEKIDVPYAEGTKPTLEIVGGGPRAGRYRVDLTRRSLDAAARRRVEAERTFAAAEGMRRKDDPRSNTLGEALFRQALADFEALALADRVADVHDRLGRLALQKSDGRAAAEAYERAVPALRRANRRSELADSLNGLGHAYRLLGRAAEALPLHQEALAFFRGIDEPEGEARSLNHLGRTFSALRRTRQAFEAYEQELGARGRAGQVAGQGLTYANRARLRADSGDAEGARVEFAAALPLLTAARRSREVAAVWVDLVPVHFALGQPEEALLAGERALALATEQRDPVGQADALTNLAWLGLGLGQGERSEQLARQALAVFQRLGRREGRAKANLILGQALTILGHSAEAAVALEQSRQDFLALSHTPGLASAAHALAKASASRGDPESALGWIEQALSRVETLRGEVDRGELRSALLAKRGDIYELAVDILARLEGHRPGRGNGRRALAAAEQGKARSLLDALGRGTDEAIDAPPTLSPDDLANLRLPGGHLTAIYSLGHERSWLFVLDAEGLRLFELAPRRKLEEAARRARFLLAAGDRATNRGQTQDALAELSELLLASWLPDPPPPRLTIVPDGALAYVPFAALPLPASASGQALLSASEITYAPSLSIAARLAFRSRERRSRPRPQGLAVVADPVFSPQDPRFARRPSGLEPARQYLPRLPHTGREAEALVALASPRPALLLRGFEARRAWAESSRPADFRYLHFATHAVVDPGVSAFSGLALSNFGPDGRAEDGFLRVPEIARLRLKAELVVLSACETAAGKEVRGEGLVGLVQAFLESGAERVLVSLFPVDDQDAAELMQHFYLGLFTESLSPAAALREAQRSLAADPARAAPAHWAPWVLLGPPH